MVVNKYIVTIAVFYLLLCGYGKAFATLSLSHSADMNTEIIRKHIPSGTPAFTVIKLMREQGFSCQLRRNDSIQLNKKQIYSDSVPKYSFVLCELERRTVVTTQWRVLIILDRSDRAKDISIIERNSIGSFDLEKHISFEGFIVIFLTILFGVLSILTALAIAVCQSKREELKLLKQYTEIYKVENVLKKVNSNKPAEYFRNEGPTWCDFANEYVYRRPEIDIIIQAILHNDNKFISIEGQKGAGKTVCSRAIAYNLATLPFLKRFKVFIVKDANDLKNSIIDNLAFNFKKFDSKKTVLIIDECHFNPETTDKLVQQLYAHTHKMKVLLLMRPSLNIEKLRDLPISQTIPIYAESIAEKIVKWFSDRNCQGCLSDEQISKVTEASGNDLLYLGKILKSWHNSFACNATDFDIDNLKKQVYIDLSNQELNSIQSQKNKAILAVSALNTFQIKADKQFFIEDIKINEACIDELIAIGELQITTDGSISRGDTSEAKLLFESAKHTQHECFRLLESEVRSLPLGLIDRYLQFKSFSLKRRPLESTAGERDKLRERFLMLSTGEPYEWELVHSLFRENLATIENLLSTDPDDWTGWAMIAMNVGNFETTRLFKEKAITLVKEYESTITEETLLHTAILCRELGEYESAKDIFKTILRRYPKYYKAVYVYGNFLIKLHENLEAEKQYQICLQYFRDALSLSKIARFYYQVLNNFGKADTLFKEAIATTQIGDLSNERPIDINRAVDVIQSYVRFLIKKPDPDFEKAKNLIESAKKIANKPLLGLTELLDTEANLYICQLDYANAEVCYEQALETNLNISDHTTRHYVNFLIGHGDRIINADGTQRYPLNQSTVKAIQLLEQWLDKYKAWNKHPSVIFARHQLGTILYTKLVPPDFTRAEEELRKAYRFGSGSGDLQDARTDHEIGRMYENRDRHNHEMMWIAEEHLQKSFNAIHIGDSFFNKEYIIHKMIAGNSLGMFLWKVKKDPTKAASVYEELRKIYDKYKLFNIDSLAITMLHNYAQLESSEHNLNMVKNILENEINIKGDDIHLLTSYAIVLKKIAYKSQKKDDFIFAAKYFWKILNHDDHRRKELGKTTRIITSSFKTACLELSTMMRRDPINKPWSSARLLEFIFQQNKQDIKIAEILIDTLWKSIAPRVNSEHADALITRFPNDPFCWFLKAAVLRRNYCDIEIMKYSYKCAYDLLGADSCREQLYRERNLSKWIS